MNHHMQKHKPLIHLTEEQERKKMELAGRALQGNQHLQRRLSSQFGVQNIADVELPPECQIFISEAPAL